MTRALLGATLWACALTGFAQTAPNAAPPIRSTVDANGVDRFRRILQFSTTDLTIGQPGAGGMSFIREYYLRGWRHNFIGTMNSDGTTYTVSIGGFSESFAKSGSSFIPQQGSGSALTYSSSTHKYTYRDQNGAVAVFNQTLTTVSTVTSNEGIIESLAYPDGETLTFFYTTINVCDYSTGCSVTWTARRLQGVRNSFGYLIKFNYPFNGTSPMDAVNQDAWLNFNSVTGINVATDYCNPQADTCPAFSQTWPTSSYSRSGNTETVTDTTGRQTVFTYNNAGISAIRRPGSSTDDVTIGYDTNTSIGIVQSYASNGMTWTYSYEFIGNSFYTRATDSLGHVNEMGFDSTSMLLTSEKNGAAEQTIYQRDISGRVQGLYLPDGTSRGYAYDSRGNLTSVLFWPAGGGAAVTVFTAGYDATCPTARVKCNKPNWTRDANNNQTDYTYNTTHGGLLTVTLPAPVSGGVRPVTTNTWTSLQAYFYKNAAGSLVASGEGVFLLTQTSSCRTLATCAGGADELRTVIGYGATNVPNNRLPLTRTLRNGTNSVSAVTTTAYDPVGNVVSVDGPLAGTVDTYVTHYDALRRVIGQVGPDPDGGGPRPSVAVRTTYDARGAPVSVETGTVTGQTIAAWSGFVPLQVRSRDFDSALRPIKSTLSASGVTYAVEQTSYDSVGRVDCVATRMNPTLFASLPASACTPTTPGSYGPDRIVQSGYDSADRVVTVTSGVGSTHPITEQTRSFATTGNLATIADGKGNTTSYEYDTFGRLFRIRYPDPTTAGVSSATDYEELQYNLKSEVVSTRRRSQDLVLTPRDNLGRIVEKDLPSTSTEDVYFSYDNDGRVISALFGSPSGTGIVQGYDGLGRVTSRTINGRVVGYAYDAASRRTRLTYPDGYFVNYGYSNTGELLTLTDSNSATLGTYTYDALANPTGMTRPNSATTTLVPDAISRIQSVQDSLTGTAYDSSITLNYNPAGEIASSTQSNDTAYTWMPATPNSTDNSGVNGQNQLTSFNGITTTRDSNGNLQGGIGSISYGYDVQGQLRTATGAGNTVAVDYDPTGMLSRVTVNGAATDYLYDGPDLIAQYSGTTILRRFVHGVGSDEPLVWFEGSATNAPKFLHADERGSIITVSDGTGNAAGSVKYSPDGQSGALASPFGYTGQLYISSLDLYYYKARMYSPRTGRFMQPDPSGYDGGMNLYAYVSGDPINATDPWGLADQPLPGVTVTGTRPQPGDPCDSACQWIRAINGNGGVITPAQIPEVVVSVRRIGTCPSAVNPAAEPPNRQNDQNGIKNHDHRNPPPGSVEVTAPDGTRFWAPAWADFKLTYVSGQLMGHNWFSQNLALGHWGTSDFQRNGSTFIHAYTNASNYAVGIGLYAAGYSRQGAIDHAATFTFFKGSNVGDPNLALWQGRGWDAAQSGACARGAR